MLSLSVWLFGAALLAQTAEHTPLQTWTGLDFTKALPHKIEVEAAVGGLSGGRDHAAEADVDFYYSPLSHLTVGANYQHWRYMLGSGALVGEHRWTGEATLHWTIAEKWQLSDRSRSDSRFVGGRFRQDYANRLKIARWISVKGCRLKPYASLEPVYEFDLHDWSTRRYAAGVQVAVSKHVVLDFGYFRETNFHYGDGLQIVGPVVYFNY